MSKKSNGTVMTESDRWDLQEHAEDFMDTFDNEEIALMVREGILTMEEVEAGLRRRKYV